MLLFSIGVTAQEKLRIKGKIEGIPNEATLSLSYENKQKEFKAIDGVFEVDVLLEQAPTSVFLSVINGDDYKYTSFFLGNEAITINASINDFPNEVKTIGSNYDGLRYENYSLTKDLDLQFRDLDEQTKKAIEGGEDRDSVYNKAEVQWQAIKKQMAIRNYGFLKQYINTDYGRHLIRFYTADFTTEQLKELYSLVSIENKSRKEMVFLKTFIDYKELEIGDKYYDFTAIDVKGKTVKFSDYFKGKYVLLDFSNVGCGFCYKAAPLTAVIADELKDKLIYVTYHTGDSEEGVKDYYKLKGNKGNVIWNKDGDYDIAIAKYRQMSTPTYLIFDTKGRFIKEINGVHADFKGVLEELMK